MRLPLKAGRDFNSADFAIQAQRVALPPGKDPDPKSPPLPAIVNETFARRFFAGTNPMGQHIEDALPEDTTKPRGPGWVVVGIAGDAKYDSLRADIGPTMYIPWVGNGAFSIRASSDPKQLIPAIRDVVNRRDSNLALFRIASESEQIERQVFVEHMVAQLSTFFAVLALVLACAGIYGLLSYEVTRRTREIGIRMAIGAQQNNVISMIVKHGLALALVGAAIGIVASVGATRLLGSLLYGVHAGRSNHAGDRRCCSFAVCARRLLSAGPARHARGPSSCTKVRITFGRCPSCLFAHSLNLRWAGHGSELRIRAGFLGPLLRKRHLFLSQCPVWVDSCCAICRHPGRCCRDREKEQHHCHKCERVGGLHADKHGRHQSRENSAATMPMTTPMRSSQAPGRR